MFIYIFIIVKDSDAFKNSPVYSGKQIVKGDRLILSSNKSFLFKNKIIDVSTNHFELQIESNNFIDSIMRFISSSSANTKSYPVCVQVNVWKMRFKIPLKTVFTWERDTKYNCCYTFETMYPLFSFGSLSTNIKHSNEGEKCIKYPFHSSNQRLCYHGFLSN